MGVANLAALAHARTDIEYDVRLLAGREGISVEAYTRCGGKLCGHAIVVEYNGIVTGGGHLGVAVEARTVAAAGFVGVAGSCLDFTYGRREYHTADLKLMQIGKALDGVVAVVVAHGLPSAGVSKVSVGGWSQLGHTEGHCRRCEEKPA